MTLDAELFSLISLGLSLISLAFTIAIYLRVNKFFKKGDGQSFEGTVTGVLKNIDSLNDFHQELSEYLKAIEIRLKRSTQIALTNRYNPFKGVGEGGQQSHSTALISENGDGVILSTLATRDRVSVFAKPIKGFNSHELELTPEEKEVLESARKVIS